MLMEPSIRAKGVLTYFMWTSCLIRHNTPRSRIFSMKSLSLSRCSFLALGSHFPVVDRVTTVTS